MGETIDGAHGEEWRVAILMMRIVPIILVHV